MRTLFLGTTFWSRASQAVIVLLSCALALGLGVAAAAFEFGFRELVIVALAAACVLFALMPTERVMYFGFALWILSLGIGWRGIWFTTYFRLYAAEVITWLLFVLVVLRTLIVERQLKWHLPKILVVLLLPAFLGIWIGLNNGVPLDVVFADFKLFVLAIPAVFITQTIVTDVLRWQKMMLLVLVIAVYISVLGIIEFLFPSLLTPLRGFFAADSTITSNRGFVRAAFTFWGHPSVSVFLLTAFPIACYYLLVEPSGKHRLFGAISVALIVAGIYVAGHRGVWIALSVACIAFALLNIRKGGWLVAGGIAILPFLPAIFYEDLAPILDANTYYDTSVLKRFDFFQGAAQSLFADPFFGRGWGSSGWVHNDFLQLGANLGVPALFALLSWYGFLLWRLYAISKNSAYPRERQEYAQLLIAGVIGLLIAVQFEVVISLAALAVCFWCYLALVWRFTELHYPIQTDSAVEFSSVPTESL